MADEANNDQITVVFTSLKTGRKAKFPARKDAIFNDVVNEAYKELGERKQSGDHILCENGPPLDEYLNETLQYVIDNVCKKTLFSIKGPSGGAFFYFERQ